MSVRASTDRIVVHMSETSPKEPTSAADIRRFHMAPPPKGRGWTDIAYNHYIRRDGTVETGRGWDAIGSHATGWNGHSVGVCLEGGLGATISDTFASHFTAEQDIALREYIAEARRRYGPLALYGHKAAPSCAPEKQCPGFDVGAWYQEGA